MRFSHPLLWITLLAAALRLYDLSGESLWLDEATTSLRNSFQYEHLADDWTQGPLYIAITKAFCSVFGETEFTLRLPSALFGVATVMLMFPLGSALLGPSAGALAAFLMAINPFAVHYSQDARPYSLFMLLAVAAFYLLTRLAVRFRLADAVLFILSVAACLYTHPFAVFLLPAFAIAYPLLTSTHGTLQRKGLWQMVAVFVIILLFFLPQLGRFGGLFLQKAETASIATWIDRPTFLLLYWTWRNYFMMHVLAGLAALIIAFGIYRLRRTGRRERIVAGLLCLWGCCMVIVPWLISLFVTPIYVIRYTAPAVAAVVLLLTFALLRMRRSLRVSLLAAIVLLSAVTFWFYYSGADKEPWRQTADFLREHKTSSESIIVFPRYLKDPFRFYCSAREYQSVAGIPPDTTAFDVRALPGFWFVTAYGSEYGDQLARHLSAFRTSHTPTEVVNMLEHIRPNPFAYYLAPITLTHFVATAEAKPTP